MSKSQWENIFTHLESCGYVVYPPATKRGDCTKPYLVVKQTGQSQAPTISSRIALFDILVYIPQNQYSTIDSFVEGVENAMKELWPKIRPIQFRTPPFLDDSNKAWMVSLQYQNYQKNQTF